MVKFHIELDSDTTSPDIVGEYLRGKFFKQDGLRKTKWNPEGVACGCYDTFALNMDVLELPMMGDWTCAVWNGIEMRYLWDGDGILTFIFPDGSTIYNSDCKKSYGWERRDGWDWDPELTSWY